jgi:hypothetical protein
MGMLVELRLRIWLRDGKPWLRRNNSGSLAMLAAIRRASSLVSSLAAERD